MSPVVTSVQSRPQQMPLTATITGLAIRRNGGVPSAAPPTAHGGQVGPSSLITLPSSGISVTSAPVQKARPVAVTVSSRTLVVALRARRAVRGSVIMKGSGR